IRLTPAMASFAGGSMSHAVRPSWIAFSLSPNSASINANALIGLAFPGSARTSFSVSAHAAIKAACAAGEFQCDRSPDGILKVREKPGQLGGAPSFPTQSARLRDSRPGSISSVRLNEQPGHNAVGKSDPRKAHRRVGLISDVLPLGRLGYGRCEPPLLNLVVSPTTTVEQL